MLEIRRILLTAGPGRTAPVEGGAPQTLTVEGGRNVEGKTLFIAIMVLFVLGCLAAPVIAYVTAQRRPQ